MSANGGDRVMELRFPALPDTMRSVRDCVRAALADCPFDDGAVEDIVLAISEACQNVMRHGYGDGTPGDIVLTVSRAPDGVVVRVADFAPTLDPARIRARDLSEVRPGGLGVHFISELMDTAEFLPGPDGVGNVLQMTRKTRVTT